MEFTYYGDLLGTSGFYKLGTKNAYNKLDDFYRTTFDHLSDYCDNHEAEVQANLFSDSLVIWGEDHRAILKILNRLYQELIKQGLLLRGSIVKGKLKFEPRFELKNFVKQLPKTDVLARALGLEGSFKGARLIIESPLAEELFEGTPNWATIDGYFRNIRHQKHQFDHLLRALVTKSVDS